MGNTSLPRGKKVNFTTTAAVDNYLPARGTPGVFSNTLTNPESTSAGVFGGQLLAAMLTQYYTKTWSDLSKLTFATSCRDVSTAIRGLTVNQVIFIANQVISGSSSTAYRAYTPSMLSQALTVFNEAFDGCEDVSNRPCFVCHNDNQNNAIFDSRDDTLQDILPGEGAGDDSDGLDSDIVGTPAPTGASGSDHGLFIGVLVFVGVIIVVGLSFLFFSWYTGSNKAVSRNLYNKKL